jgi:hypothetical protein
MSISNEIFKRLEDINFFQITVYADEEIDGEIYKNVRQRNDNSTITTKNWGQHKDVFFNERMATYDNSFKIKEKIKLELEALENLPCIEEKYKVLKDRYIDYLCNIKN